MKGARPASGDNCVITSMTIRCAHESWAGGASDVYIYGGSTFINGIDPATGLEANWRVFQSDRNQIRNFSGDDLNKSIDVNYWCYTNWQPHRPEPGPRGDYFFYTIYEADNWPAGWKETDVYVGTRRFTLEYRSADPCYQVKSFNLNDLKASGHTGGSPIYGCSFSSMKHQ